jgi:hypothetical protein
MVEPQIVVLVVAGSSPVGHPASEIPDLRLHIHHERLGFETWVLGFFEICVCSSTG